MHKHAGKSFGFTFMETLISMALFGVIMALIFGSMKLVMTIWRAEEMKHSVHKRFVKVNRALEIDLGLSNSSFFSSYIQDKTGETIASATIEGIHSAEDFDSRSRWFAFPFARQDNKEVAYQRGTRDFQGNMKVPTDSLLWKQTILYYLHRPGSDTCKNWNCCPHKQLIRKELGFDSAENGKFPGTYSSCYVDETYVLGPSNGLLKSNITPFLLNQEDYGARVIEKNIFDLQIAEVSKGSVSFEMILIREETEGVRRMRVGDIDFANPNERARKFIEKIGWTTITKNY